MMRLLLCLILIGSFGFFFSYSLDVDLANLTPSQGFQIYGDIPGRHLGQSVKSVGDVNGDAEPDILIGTPSILPPRGAVVVYGGETPYPFILDLAAPPANYGFQIQSELDPAVDQSLGNSVDNTGDINGDNVADMLIGGPFSEQSGFASAGVVYVLFGNEGGFPNTVPTTSISNGDGFKVIGAAIGNLLGISLSNGGDIDNDGFDDVVIGAPNAEPNGVSLQGAAYVIYGKPSAYPNVIDTSSWDNSLGFRATTSQPFANVGIAVTIGGDINGDSIDDLVISAPFYDSNLLTENGAVFVIFGNVIKKNSDIDLANLQPNEGFMIIGGANFNRIGTSVYSAGDINGDGINDIIIGAYYVDASAGAYYVIYGRSLASPFPNPLNVGSMTVDDGFKIITSMSGGIFGQAIASSGDVNGDGIDDIIISSIEGAQGIVYVLYGNENGFDAVVDVNQMTTQQGFKITGPANIDFTGTSLSSGDINDDGVDDIVIGAPQADPLDREEAGIVYVVYGVCSGGYINWDGTCVSECNPSFISTTDANGQKYCNYPCKPKQFLNWLGKCSCICNGVEEIVNGHKICKKGAPSLDL